MSYWVCEMCKKKTCANTFVYLDTERTKRVHIKCFAKDFFEKLKTPLKEPMDAPITEEVVTKQ